MARVNDQRASRREKPKNSVVLRGRVHRSGRCLYQGDVYFIVGDQCGAGCRNNDSAGYGESRTTHWHHEFVLPSDILRKGPNSLREGDKVTKAVAVLVEYGWLVELPSGTIVDGKKRKKAYKIIRL